MLDLSKPCPTCGDILSHCAGHAPPEDEFFTVLSDSLFEEEDAEKARLKTARTKNEPQRPIRPTVVAEPRYLPRTPRKPVLEDTPELRKMVADRACKLVDAYDAYMAALKAFGEMDNLPDTITRDLPLNVRRSLRLYRHKGERV